MKRILRRFGLELVRLDKQKIPVDFEQQHVDLIRLVQPYTMTSPERIFGLAEAVNYIVKNQIEGDVVECGVWKGGSMLAVAQTLLNLQETKRHLYLYDTFEGMPAPEMEDVSYADQQASELLAADANKEKNLVWAYSALETVRQTMQLCKYPDAHIHYVQGKVEDTIPATMPGKIALLRLDTDWYASTKHELEHLFPLLVPGGVLIIDDYGFWKGARKAVDEYFQEHKTRILLNRMDETGRIAVKQ
ncbi:TylF/MycF/NovP-related O-methyltransferase [Paracnuella aquatica]|uniref:TylF/MycF/NovP-related O-methyltransferase n=1 Tax=Paracnuella aquatica TaxID=2268757 RepID=UPI000DEF3738|nr:TylF/MycF/NovP-related O-methyltransferase [Paracnuella aquatica]RPD51331.1 macrocin O-methyltransferase [Paracnuella aquatica]